MPTRNLCYVALPCRAKLYVSSCAPLLPRPHLREVVCAHQQRRRRPHGAHVQTPPHVVRVAVAQRVVRLAVRDGILVALWNKLKQRKESYCSVVAREGVAVPQRAVRLALRDRENVALRVAC